MPYINEEAREALDDSIDALIEQSNHLDFEKGNMNYCITRLIHAYVEFHNMSYETLSDVTGVLNDVKTEFERRVVAQYEDEKIKENGDVMFKKARVDDLSKSW